MMNAWTIMSPHARLVLRGERIVELTEFLDVLPGLKFRRESWHVPYNALRVVNRWCNQLGIDVVSASWATPPPKPVTWDEVEAKLRAGGEIRDFVLNGFLLPYQKEAIAFAWPRSGVHFWHPTGSGKTLSGLAASLSVPGPVLVVTRAASRIQYAREIEKFFHVKALVLRPASNPGPKRIGGMTYNEFRASLRGRGLTPAAMSAAWREREKELGVDPPETLVDYREACTKAGTRPFVVVGWESLADRIKELLAYRPAVVIYDESHRGKSTKRYEVVHLPDLPEDPIEGSKVYSEWEADAKKQGGFLKHVENEGYKLFVPQSNTSTSAALIARSAKKRIATTATPVKDRVRDLWAQLDLVEPNSWGSSTDFRYRYCLDPVTPVLMGDGTYRSIGEIHEGDEVIGWSEVSGKRFLHRTKVVATQRREAEVIQLRLASGRVIRCTRDHHWLYSLSAKTRPYRPVCRWSETEQRWNRSLNHLLRVGPPPEGWAARWTEMPSGQKHVWWTETAEDPAFGRVAYKLGYIRGLIDGDGHRRISENAYEPKTAWGKARRKKRKSTPKAYQMSIFQKNPKPLERAARYAEEIDLRTSGVSECRDPQGYVLGFYSKEAYRRLATTGWDSASSSYKRGWLAGMYDAEGHGDVISQVENVNPQNHYYLQLWLKEFGFDVGVRPDSVRIKGGRWELLRFFDLVRPEFTYKLDALFERKPNFRFREAEKDCILSAARLKGTHEVVSIQTETGNYIAAGYASKNCAMKPGAYGGMDDRGSSNLDELKERVDTIAHVLTYELTHGQLPPKRRQSVYVAPEDQTKELGGFANELRQARKRGATAVVEVRLAQAASRKRKAVLSLIEDHLSSGHKITLFTGRRKDCDELGKLVRSLTLVKKDSISVWSAHGELSTTARQAIVDDYMEHPGPCVLVGTGHAFGESLNIDTTDAAIFTMLPYDPGQLRQWEGRFHRASTKRPVIIYYVIAEGTVDEHVASILIEKLPAVEQVAEDKELGEAAYALAGIDPTMSEEDFAASVLASFDED